nr:12622_t:CDS:2 [Entrophospora candida]
MSNNSNLFAGFDLSTQQLKFTAINEIGKVVFEELVNFDKELPSYGTKNGVISNENVVICPTLMWVESIDLLLNKLSEKKFPFHQIKAMSGAAQQHGSVYWSENSLGILENLNPTESLVSQFINAFSIPDSPTWQDSSTTEQCKNLEKLIGGKEILVNLSGSIAYERFTGNQMTKFSQTNPLAYSKTKRISLISSFLASIFLDGDGEKLKLKLDCRIIPFTGDNPATLISMNLTPGDILISLGTSDTILLYTTKPSPTIESHTLCHPTNPSAYMSMICYKNGSLTREYIRDKYTTTIRNDSNDTSLLSSAWTLFNQLLKTSKPNKRKMGFYFLVQEIIPFAKGIYRFEDSQLIDEFQDDPKLDNVRCIIESQFISMRIRIEKLINDFENLVNKVVVVGGASKNHEILQVLSDVFGKEIWKQKHHHNCNDNNNVNAASMGAAMKAKMAFNYENDFEDEKLEINSFVSVVKPRIEYTDIYKDMFNIYKELENIVINNQISRIQE